MSKILKFREYLSINESEFNQYQLDASGPFNPLGPGYGFAIDPGLSIYGNDDGVYMDYYARQSGYINHLQQVIKSGQQNDYAIDIQIKKQDNFLDDLEKFSNLKILRIFNNDYLNLDVYISFEIDGNEFFGVFRKFNSHTKPKLESELLTDPRYRYIDKEYYLKLSNHFYKILSNWFIPKKGFYKNLKEGYSVKDEIGNLVELKKGAIIEVKGYNKKVDDKPYIILKQNNKIYTIDNNDYFFFNYRFEKV